MLSITRNTQTKHKKREHTEYIFRGIEPASVKIIIPITVECRHEYGQGLTGYKNTHKRSDKSEIKMRKL